jgi:plasmid stability protein
VRTTLTLDEDVAHKLREAARRSGRSFKDVVNEALRIGLHQHQTERSPRKFVVQPRDLGLRDGLSLDNIGDLLEEIEGPSHR